MYTHIYIDKFVGLFYHYLLQCVKISYHNVHLCTQIITIMNDTKIIDSEACSHALHFAHNLRLFYHSLLCITLTLPFCINNTVHFGKLDNNKESTLTCSTIPMHLIVMAAHSNTFVCICIKPVYIADRFQLTQIPFHF